MPLMCTTCGASNHDPGGDPHAYTCGNCGQPTLHRPAKSFGGDILPVAFGAASLGAILFGAAGAAVGGVLGAILALKSKP